MPRDSSDSASSSYLAPQSTPHPTSAPAPLHPASHNQPSPIRDTDTPPQDPSPEPMYYNQGNPAFEYHAGKNLGKKSRTEMVKKGVKRNWVNMRDALCRAEGEVGRRYREGGRT